MAALTSAGLWPGNAYQTFPFAPSYKALKPRAVINLPVGFTSQVTPVGISAATTVPVAPSVTRYPVVP